MPERLTNLCYWDFRVNNNERNLITDGCNKGVTPGEDIHPFWMRLSLLSSQRSRSFSSWYWLRQKSIITFEDRLSPQSILLLVRHSWDKARLETLVRVIVSSALPLLELTQPESRPLRTSSRLSSARFVCKASFERGFLVVLVWSVDSFRSPTQGLTSLFSLRGEDFISFIDALGRTDEMRPPRPLGKTT